MRKTSDMAKYFDRLETRTADERETSLFSSLPAFVAHAKSKSLYYAKLLEHFDPAAVTSRRALADLPVTRKSPIADSAAIVQTLVAVTRLRGTVEQAPAGSLTTVGPLITDTRKYD